MPFPEGIFPTRYHRPARWSRRLHTLERSRNPHRKAIDRISDEPISAGPPVRSGGRSDASRAQRFLPGRLNTPTISTCGEWRNWSTGVTVSSR